MPTIDEADDRSEPADSIEDILVRSAAAWNAGDLKGFLAFYEDSPDTIYLNTTRVVTGYTAIQKMYSERFDTEHALGAGILSMSLLRVAPLGSEHALAVGRYSLKQAPAQTGPACGVFSLVFRKTPAGWRITADHAF
jgi:ketosteroid isomerase-like protein